MLLIDFNLYNLFNPTKLNAIFSNCQTPKAFSVTNTDDLKLALETIREKCPNASVYGIGFSLGGLINY